MYKKEEKNYAITNGYRSEPRQECRAQLIDAQTGQRPGLEACLEGLTSTLLPLSRRPTP